MGWGVGWGAGWEVGRGWVEGRVGLGREGRGVPGVGQGVGGRGWVREEQGWGAAEGVGACRGGRVEGEEGVEGGGEEGEGWEGEEGLAEGHGRKATEVARAGEKGAQKVVLGVMKGAMEVTGEGAAKVEAGEGAVRVGEGVVRVGEGEGEREGEGREAPGREAAAVVARVRLAAVLHPPCPAPLRWKQAGTVVQA